MTASVAIWAHRGSSDPALGIRENTLAAFVRAWHLGADGVELDVRLTRDGALAVHHDPRIRGAGKLAALDVRDLPAHVPLLVDVLGACPGMTVNIEVKNLPTEAGYDPHETAAQMVAGLVIETAMGDGAIVSSFWPRSLEAVVAVNPTIPTGLLLRKWANPSRGIEMARKAGCRALHPHRSSVTARLVDEAHAAGLRVNAWTVDDPASLAAMADCGVDAIITDDVPLAVTTLGGT